MENQINFWKVATIVLFIVLIGIGGIYLFNTQSQKPVVTSSQQLLPKEKTILSTIIPSQQIMQNNNLIWMETI